MSVSLNSAYFVSGRPSFSLPNIADGHHKLIKRLGHPCGLLVALEPTGGCEGALWEALEAAGFEGRQVSAAHVCNLARSLDNLAKTDPPDARIKTLLQSDESLNERAQFLRSISGIGPVLTAALIGQIPELGCLEKG